MRGPTYRDFIQRGAVALVTLWPAIVAAQSGYFGTAAISIDPTTPIMLSGYAARSGMGEASSVQEDIVAQAAVFGTGPDASLLITVDSTGVPDNVIDPLKQQLGATLGLAPERIVVTSTHSHSCPQIAGYLSNLFDPPLTPLKEQHVEKYTQLLSQKLEEVAIQAMNHSSPGHVFTWGNGSVGFAANRRGQAVAPVDHDLPVMVVRDSLGQVDAVLTSYASHAVTLNAGDNLVSGDWPGYAREAIEAMYPGATALIMIGAAGDANPSPAGSPDIAQSHGQEVADEVQRLISQNALKPVAQQITALHTELDLPYATTLAPGDPSSARLAPSPSSAPYGVTSWTFGKDLAMVFMEGEVVSDYSLRLKQELGDKIWVNAYSNDVQGYIPSERILYEGGYEADDSTYYYAVPGRFAHGLEDKIVGAVNDQLAQFTGLADRLRLVVDWKTGGLSIANLGGAVVSFDGYTIASPSGALSKANGRWNSLQDQGRAGWDEADNSSSFRLTEFKTIGALTLNQGGAISLGAPLTISPPARFGDPLPEAELTFEYSVPGEGTVQGLIGSVPGSQPHNNLVLTIDPATGAAAIQNESPFFDVAITAYTISSASGKLVSSNAKWQSLQDQGMQGWDEADNSSAFRLTEFKTSGGTLLAGGGTILRLGTPVDTAGGGPQLSDLNFQFLLSTGQVLNGVIEFASMASLHDPADFDGDGDIDGADVLVWQRTLGATGLPPGSGADANGDGRVDGADLAVWRTRVTAANSVPSSGAVPEPSSLMMMLPALLCGRRLLRWLRGRGSDSAAA
jgi:hypothetical protein